MPVPHTPIFATGGIGKGVGVAAQDTKEVHPEGKCGRHVGGVRLCSGGSGIEDHFCSLLDVGPWTKGL